MRFLSRVSGAALLLLLLGSLASHPGAARAVPLTLVVNSSAATLDGVCDAQCTLADAITATNSNGNPTELDIITFAIPGDGPHVIMTTGLPAVSQPVRIHGSSQPGTVCAPEGRQLQLEIRGPGSTLTGIDITDTSTIGVEVNGIAFTDLATGVRTNAGSNHIIRCTNMGVSTTGEDRSIATGIALIGTSANVQIGGNSANGRNVIVGGTASAISALSTGGHVIQNNWIGVRPDGVTADPGTNLGITFANSTGNTLKGNVIIPAPTGLRIAGNGGANVIQGNTFGYLPDGVTTVPAVTGLPIQIYALNDGEAQVGNVIGGVGAGEPNKIFTPSIHAIQIISSATTSVINNSVRGNEILAGSTGRAIALVVDGQPSSTVANDALDADEGPNHLQNFPVLSTAVDNGDATGSLHSTPNTSFIIDFYAGGTCASFAKSLQRYVTSANVMTDVNGDATIAVTGLPGLIAGEGLKATATDTAGNTSEVSVCRTVTAAPVEKTITDLNPDLVVSGNSTRQMSLIGTGLVNGDVVKIDGVDAPTTFISATELEFTITAEQMDVAPTHFTISIDGATNTRLLFLTSSRSDADCSGVTTAADALMVLNILAGLAEPPKGCSGGDANNSSAITLADAIYIRLDLVGLVEPIAEII